MALSVAVRRRLALGLTCATVLAMPLLGGARASAPPPCTSSQLTVWRAEPGEGAAGSFYYQLELSNVSRTTCSLSGFPGVRAVTSSGRPLGRPAAPDRTGAPGTVTLAPGATAHAVLRVVDVGVFPPSSCRPVTAAGLRVRPPHVRTAAVVPLRTLACARKGPVYLFVRAVRPGVGIPGHSQ